MVGDLSAPGKKADGNSDDDSRTDWRDESIVVYATNHEQQEEKKKKSTTTRISISGPVLISQYSSLPI